MCFFIAVANVSAKAAEFRLAFLFVVAITPGFFVGAVPFGTAFFTFFEMGFLRIGRFIQLARNFLFRGNNFFRGKPCHWHVLGAHLAPGPTFFEGRPYSFVGVRL